jgi:prepilin-type N-terminal cleavage/methylation domain-containing protein
VPRQRKLAGESGLTLIEVMIAILIITVGLVGALDALISSSKLSVTSQRVQATATAAEQTMEQLRAMNYSSLALSSLPTQSSSGNPAGDTSGNPLDPDYWVSGSNLLIVSNFNQETSATLSDVSSSGEPLVGGGSVSPGPVSVSSDGFTVSVYTFITWVADNCVFLGVNLCPGTENAKRVTVAAVIQNGGGIGAQKPFWLSTIVPNPNAI